MAKTTPSVSTYADGTPVALRDLATGPDHQGNEVAGVVVGCNPDGANGSIEIQYLAPCGKNAFPRLNVQTFDGAGKGGLTACTVARAFGDSSKFRKLIQA